MSLEEMNKYAPLITPILLGLVSVFTGVMLYTAKGYIKDFKNSLKMQQEMLIEIRSTREKQVRTDNDVSNNTRKLVKHDEEISDLKIGISEIHGELKLINRKLDDKRN